MTITSCSKNDLVPAVSESAVNIDKPSLDDLAVKFAEILQIGNENNWFGHADLITGLMKPGRSITPGDIDVLETTLGIPLQELNWLITELGTAAFEYYNALDELNLTDDDRTALIHDAFAESGPLEGLQGIMIDEQGRCFLQDMCNIIGVFLVDVWFYFNCDFFCEEEVLPYYILVRQICEIFPC